MLTNQLMAITFAVIALLVASAPACRAQARSLPRAGFQTFSTGALPSSSGLYLRPGENRAKNNQAQPYDPRHKQLGFVRWEHTKMPLHVWISPGLKLPDAPFSELQSTRVDLVRTLLNAKQPLAGLEQAPGWTENLADLAAAGFEEWRIFESEGLLSFDFTEDPRLAHILVFWTEGFKDADSAGGTYVHALTCSQPIPVAQVRELEAQGKKFAPIGYVLQGQANVIQNPVVIELSTGSEARMRGAAAHEFGHSLGIIEHSPYREDLMYVDRIVDDLSAGDKATFRALYRTAPQGVF